MPLTLTAVHDVAEEWAGVASAVLNTAQQIGAALGVAVLATISTFVTNQQLPEAAKILQEGLAGNDTKAVVSATDALTAGYTTGFLAGSGMLVFAALIVALTVKTKRIQGTSEAGSEGLRVGA